MHSDTTRCRSIAIGNQAITSSTRWEVRKYPLSPANIHRRRPVYPAYMDVREALWVQRMNGYTVDRSGGTCDCM
ncbi:hypothetical protein SAMN05444167_1780 [Terriglobus roseus]|uniref:Uncharacterized protein n=1 Tax=Terriglobus roseus TaxID=392734 RepID=A0A1G7JDE9_9BACT|nr:hypothetical protein SAMN05444167_1780 [Terriglobus roseus]